MYSSLELGMFFGRSYFEFLYSKVTVRKIHYCIVPVYSYFEKGCRIKCTRQPRKVLWVVFQFTVFQGNLKEWQERPWTYVCEC